MDFNYVKIRFIKHLTNQKIFLSLNPKMGLTECKKLKYYNFGKSLHRIQVFKKIDLLFNDHINSGKKCYHIRNGSSIYALRFLCSLKGGYFELKHIKEKSICFKLITSLQLESNELNNIRTK